MEKIKQRRRVGKGRAMWITERKNIPGRENNKYKGPEVTCTREATGWEQSGRQEGGEVRETAGVGMSGSYRHSEGLGFSSEQGGSHWNRDDAEGRLPSSRRRASSCWIESTLERLQENVGGTDTDGRSGSGEKWSDLGCLEGKDNRLR